MKKHILLIEDEHESLGVFVKALNETHLSYKCTYVKDCTHALKMLDYIVPDYIFIEQHPAALMCLEGLRSIRDKEQLRRVPVILFTNLLTSDIASKAAFAGVDHCYIKPSTPVELSNLLSDIIISFERKN